MPYAAGVGKQGLFGRRTLRALLSVDLAFAGLSRKIMAA